MSNASHIAAIIEDLIDVSQGQLATLKEYAQALQLEEGTIHLERSISEREIRRAELFSLFEQAVSAQKVAESRVRPIKEKEFSTETSIHE